MGSLIGAISPDDLEALHVKCHEDPQWESDNVSIRPLRGKQAEMVERIERHITSHTGGVMTIMSARQTGKNDIAAVCQRRHLHRNQFSHLHSSWIRTAPTYKPQIVNSKIRLREILQVKNRTNIQFPTFHRAKLQREEGYIWRVGNASVQFISSGPNANVVGATASECLDMDEAHKVEKAKFDEDFAPFTANTNAGTLLWGVASNGLDTIQWYREKNEADGQGHLNLYYPAEVWMEVVPTYAAHVEDRISKLGYDHPIIKTQYRLISVASEGRFLSDAHIRSLFQDLHERQLSPRSGKRYHAIIDVAAGNEELNPNADLEGNEETDTDSTIVWIYEVTDDLCSNNLFPIIRLVDLKWYTGVPLPQQEEEIKEYLLHWQVEKVTTDAVGVGRQIAESLEQYLGIGNALKYIATSTSVSEDCFDLLARLNFGSVRMFANDGSPEWAEFERQCNWTRYAAAKGKMKLIKPKSDMHIDMVKGLTYINRNSPTAGMQQILKVEGNYSDE